MSDKPHTRRLTGLYKVPDFEEPDDELINAVAKLIHDQIIQQSTRSDPTSNKPNDIHSK